MRRRDLVIGARYCVLIDGAEVVVELDGIGADSGKYYTTSVPDGKRYVFKRARSFLCRYVEPVTDSLHPQGL